ncbi:MAG TPA: ABC transporter substrate-binding protein [Candidatus Obscuribacterales bacterium]
MRPRTYPWQRVTSSLVSLLLASAYSCQSATIAAPMPEKSGLPPAAAIKDKVAPIKIGFVTSLSGVAAGSGRELLSGIQLYLEQVHNQIAGRPVELIIESDDSSQAIAKAKIHKLVSVDHIDLLDGILLANIGYAVAPIVDEYKLPAVYAVSPGDELTKQKHFDWVVRTSWSASQPSNPFGDYAFKTLGYKRVVTFALDYPFGWEVAGGFQKSFEEAGGKVVQKLWAPIGMRDFEPLLRKIRKDADAVFVVTTVGAAPIFPKQYAQFGPRLPIIAGGTSFDESVLSRVGDEAVGAVSAHIYSAALDTPENRKFVKAYRAKFNGIDPSCFAECGYTSGLWIGKAIESLKGKTDDKQKLLAALKKVQLTDAPRGPLKLDDRANPIENVYVRKVERVHGRLENSVSHTFPNVSQFWKWNPEETIKQPSYSPDYPPCKYCNQ